VTATADPLVIWKDVVGYEGLYLVSDSGLVKSLITGKILKPSSHNFGYLHVNLYLDKKAKSWLVQHLVAFAFLGERPVGMMVCHNDGDPANNRLSNLRYGTQSSNMSDRVIHGTHNRGEKHGMAVLSDDDVLKIREELKTGVVQRRIAEKYGVSYSLITLIKKEDIRNHVR
jgi:hypothetical protein